MTNETIVLDPPEFPQNPARVALGLDELGIRVMKADWGDSDHELFLVKQERGEIPADRHPPNRTVTIQLKAEEDEKHGVSLAEASQKLQMKVGRLQDEGGWVKRVLDVKGGYSTNVGMIVHTAVLGGLHGWQMAHRSVAPEITLTLTVGPYCYGTKEIETATFVEEVNRQLIYTIPNYQGTAPGIKRVGVKNIGGVNWLGFIGAWESRDLSEGATAEPHYTGGQLTPLGGAVKSGSEIFKSGIRSQWLVFASSKIAATGKHMTHVGGRKMHARLQPSVEGVEVRMEWRPLGATTWSINDPVTLSAGAQIVDIGAAKPEVAVLGLQKWEWRLACNKGTIEGAPSLSFYDAYIFPTELFIRAEYTPRYVAPTELKNEDIFNQGEVALNGKSLSDGSAVWVTKGGAEDYKGTTVTAAGSYLKRVTTEQITTRVALPSVTTYHIVACQCDVYHNEQPPAASVKGSGCFLGGGIGYIGASGEPLKGFGKYLNILGTEVEGVPGAYLEKMWFFNRFFPFVWKPATWYTLTFIVVGGQYAVGWARPKGTSTQLGKPEFVSTLEVAEDNLIPGIWDACNGLTQAKNNAYRAYDNFKVWIPELDAIAFAGRGLEVRSDGVYRQGSAEDVWGKVIPDGFLPTAAPSGLEARPSRGILLPSQGTFGTMSDTGINKLEVVERYFPGYHFTSEAV